LQKGHLTSQAHLKKFKKNYPQPTKTTPHLAGLRILKPIYSMSKKIFWKVLTGPIFKLLNFISVSGNLRLDKD